jgi:hypothetical protein
MPVNVNELDTSPEPTESGDTGEPSGQPAHINADEIERLLRHLHDRQHRILAD